MVSANTDGGDMAAVIQAIRATLAATPDARGYFTALEGPVPGPGQTARLIAVTLGPGCALTMILTLQRYRSTVLTLINMGNIPRWPWCWRRARAVDFGPTAVGGSAGGLHHADGYFDAQRHPQISHYINPLRVRGRKVWCNSHRARLALNASTQC